MNNYLFTEITSKDAFFSFIKNISNTDNEDNSFYLEAMNYFEDKNLQEVFSKLKNVNEERLLDVLHCIDKKLNIGNKNIKNKEHKLMTLFSTCLYLIREEYDSYSSSELVLLGEISPYEDISFYDNAHLKYSKDLLQTILAKTTHYMEEESILVLVEELYNEKKSTQDIINYIKEKDTKELLQEAFIYEKKLVGDIDDDRRFQL